MKTKKSVQSSEFGVLRKALGVRRWALGVRKLINSQISNLKSQRLLLFFLLSTLNSRLSTCLWAQELSVPQETDIPAFLADLPNPNDFSLFANGGWDGNWYVGFNTCWMQKISVPANENIQRTGGEALRVGGSLRAFIGAKLGRMKSFQPPGKAPWERKSVPGEIYMAISSTPSWNRAQSYFLTSTEEIPLEPDGEVTFEGVGESKWFWTEIPLKLVNLKGDNYLALWSPTEKLNSVSSAPILAAGWGTKEVDSWVSHEIKGFPPTDPAKAVSTPITVFEPAIALKLVPTQNSAESKPKVKIAKIEDGKARGKSPPAKVIWSSVEGVSIERAWIEISTDAKKWNRSGRPVWNAPFCFTLKTEEVPIGKDGKTWVRVGAANQLENVGVSEPVNIFERRN